ncbi:MAG: sigma-54 interaction domain-containing protein [Bacillota bacterium]
MKNKNQGSIRQEENQILTDYFVTTMEKIFDPISVPIILIDKDTSVKMINKAFADYLGYSKEYIIGKEVLQIDKNSRFPYVFKSKKAEIAWKHTFENGHTAIVHRIPVLNEHGEVMYGFGMVLFNDMEEFRHIVQKNKLLETELFHYKKQLKEIHGAKYSCENIIGSNEKMSHTKMLARKAAMTSSNVLLLGESGTGKELFAHAIHNGSTRSFSPFVKVNCAAIPSELLESELFGYEEGAFTGAKKGGKIGKFELAHRGSIFLDEIGDMPLEMQAKLLRVLQEREIEKVGSHVSMPIDVRIIAATNKDLKKMVDEKKFRQDLYYRLNVMTIEIPPLRERTDDIEELVEILLVKLSEQMGKNVSYVSPKASDYIKGHTWPGNVRELENVLERAMNLTEGDTIHHTHLPIYITQNKRKKVEDGPIRPLRDMIEDAERELISRCLEYTQGNKLQAAKLLDISRSSLYDKIEKYGFE